MPRILCYCTMGPKNLLQHPLKSLWAQEEEKCGLEPQEMRLKNEAHQGVLQ